MKNFRLPSWAFIISITLSGTAMADVCQTNSPNRIKMLQNKDQSWTAVYSTQQIGPPVALGFSTGFSLDELDQKRVVEKGLFESVKNREAGSFAHMVILIAALSGASPSDAHHLQNAAVPTGPNSEELAKANLAKESLSVLDKKFFTTSSACIYVPSIEKHAEILGRTLREIYNERPLQVATPSPQVERDLRSAKNVPMGSKPGTRPANQPNHHKTLAN